MKPLIPLSLVLAPLLSLHADQLPLLKDRAWIGNYAGYERRNFRFQVTGGGLGLLVPMDEKGKPLADRVGIRVQPVVEEVLPDGKVVSKSPLGDGWEAVTPGAVNPAKLTYRGKVAGGTSFEVNLEFDGDEIRAGGRLLEKGTSPNLLRFALRFQVPDVYYFERDAGKKLDKAEKDRLDLVRTDGKKLKLDLVTALDAETEKFNGPGVKEARVEIGGYKGNRFDFAAGENAAFEFWNNGAVALGEGFTLGWKPDPAKDKDGKARAILKVR